MDLHFPDLISNFLFAKYFKLLHLDFLQTSTPLQVLAKPELGTNPAPACSCFTLDDFYYYVVDLVYS